MRPEIILHVGTEKTGTTRIQTLLSKSYTSLIRSGVLFPMSIGTPCHINLTACALENEPQHPIRKLLGVQNQSVFDDFVEETKECLREEIKSTSPSVLVISDEHINVHLSKKESLRAFKELCEEFGEIKSVVIYFRQHDEFRLSLFSEAVKSGNLANFDILNPLPIFETIPYRLNYLAILDNLVDVFGKSVVIPRIYDRSSFPKGDIAVDFLDLSGVTIEDADSIKSERNMSVDAKVIQYLALISSSLKGLNKTWSENLRHLVIDNCRKTFKGSGPVMREETHKCFLAQFDSHNKVMKKKYFNSHTEKNLFPNNYLNNISDRTIYPDCSISWLEFFIKCVASIVRENSSTHEYVVSKNLNQPESIKENIFPLAELVNNLTKSECPICGASYLLDIATHSREGKLCPGCGASGRASAIAYHISTKLCDNVLPLIKHTTDKSKKIVGLSDGRVYADILKKKYDYTNTFYHQNPFLDITSPPMKFRGTFDLLISTEVFEHIIGPSIAAFRGAFDVLKPGGFMILTVPFVNKGESVEHYGEDLINYLSYQADEGNWEAELEFNDGHKKIDKAGKFHGGPGKTLEIRLFNRTRLISEINLAGFVEVEIHDENMPHHGINWGPASRVITARKPLSYTGSQGHD